MGKLIFITGGTRSGKSSFAVKMAKAVSNSSRVAFIATCTPEDDEMKRRIALHKRKRPSSWKTIQIKSGILKELKKIKSNYKVVIIDCLTLFVSSLLMQGQKEDQIKKKIEEIVKFISRSSYTTIAVSNEVGSGMVPENRLAREFRDLAGMANQILARRADEAYLVVSGLPIKIKPSKATP